MTNEASASLQVRVVPRASRTTLTHGQAGGLRAYLTAPPVDGAANRALVALLAAKLHLPKRSFDIVRGERGRNKVVAVHGCNQAELDRRVRAALGCPVDKVEDGG